MGKFDRLYCVYPREFYPQKLCKLPNCKGCATAIGRVPNCKYALNGSCAYYNCKNCSNPMPDNYEFIFKSKLPVRSRY